MKTVPIKDAGQLNELLGSGDEELVVTRDGRAVALVIPLDDDELHFYKLEQSPDFIESIARARRQIAHGQGVDSETVKRELGLK